jgi:hypothetical protein
MSRHIVVNTLIRGEAMRLPDLPDMMAAGMSLTQALAFWNYMKNTSERSPEEWWQVRSYT